MIETLPCSTCTALCCGPVALSRARLEKILAYIATMPNAERKRLAAQKRDELDCGFLDKENHRCAIYPVRPWQCEAFGRVEGMQCPKVGRLVQIIPALVEETSLTAEYKSGIGMNSANFYWRFK